MRKARGGLPSMLDYAVAVENDSMYNTPNTFGIFALEQVLAWVEGQGGLPAIAARAATSKSTNSTTLVTNARAHRRSTARKNDATPRR